MKEKIYSNYLPWVEYAKGFAIILVVYRHVTGGYANAGLEIAPWLVLIQQSVYNFRMPLFFILAGIFVQKSLSKRNFREFFAYKTSSILYPYFLWCFIQLTIQILFANYTNGQRNVSDYLYIIYNPFALDDQFWFLYTLFGVTILYAILDHLFKFKPLIHFLLGIIFTYLSTFPIPPQLESILYYYVFFIIGSIASSIILNPQFYKYYTKPHLAMGMLPLFFFSQWYWIHHPTLKEENVWIFNAIAFLGCCFLFTLSFYLANRNWLGFVKTIGKHSLYIYIMHVIVQAGSRAVLMTGLHIYQPEILILISTIIAIYLPIIFYQISIRRGFWFLYGFMRPLPKLAR